MKIRTKSLFFSLIISSLLFQTCIDQLKYMDEIITIICAIYLVLSSIRRKSDNTFLGMFFLMIIMTFLGILGNYIYKVQPSKIGILIDIESTFKCYICFIAFYKIFEKSKTKDKEYIIDYLTGICKITVLIGFILAIINLFYNIGMYTDISYGLRSFHFIFGRVGNLNNFCVRSLFIFTMALSNNSRNYTNTFFCILMDIFLMISTLRTRAFAYAIIYIFGYLYFIKGKRIKIKLRYIIPIILIVLYVALPKINYFFNNTTRARNVLLSYGIQTAKTYFPLGAGFATYGTNAARDYNSILHFNYGFDNYYGLSTDASFFLTDNYWPAVMGELGFFGAILMLILIIQIFKLIIKMTKDRNVARFGSIFQYITIIIASTVSSSFFNSAAVSGMILVALSLHYYENTHNSYL